jgi:hypothetical protein
VDRLRDQSTRPALTADEHGGVDGRHLAQRSNTALIALESPMMFSKRKRVLSVSRRLSFSVSSSRTLSVLAIVRQLVAPDRLGQVSAAPRFIVSTAVSTDAKAVSMILGWSRPS